MVKSAAMADKVRLEQSLHKAAASTKNARRAPRLARVVSQSAADNDYASGAFWVMLFCTGDSTQCYPMVWFHVALSHELK